MVLPRECHIDNSGVRYHGANGAIPATRPLSRGSHFRDGGRAKPTPGRAEPTPIRMTAPHPGSPISVDHIRMLRASFELNEEFSSAGDRSITVNFDFDVQ